MNQRKNRQEIEREIGISQSIQIHFDNEVLLFKIKFMELQIQKSLWKNRKNKKANIQGFKQNDEIVDLYANQKKFKLKQGCQKLIKNNKDFYFFIVCVFQEQLE
ncbi:hypothetical protein ABPG74_021722 [Tetrahymena malaccensis]